MRQGPDMCLSGLEAAVTWPAQAVQGAGAARGSGGGRPRKWGGRPRKWEGPLVKSGC